RWDHALALRCECTPIVNSGRSNPSALNSIGQESTWQIVLTAITGSNSPTESKWRSRSLEIFPRLSETDSWTLRTSARCIALSVLRFRFGREKCETEAGKQAPACSSYRQLRLYITAPVLSG